MRFRYVKDRRSSGNCLVVLLLLSLVFGSCTTFKPAPDTGYKAELNMGEVEVVSQGVPVLSSPAVSNGIVFFGANDGGLYALSQEDGHLVGRYQTAGPVSSSPAVRGKIVYFGSESGSVYALWVNAAD